MGLQIVYIAHEVLVFIPYLHTMLLLHLCCAEVTVTPGTIPVPWHGFGVQGCYDTKILCHTMQDVSAVHYNENGYIGTCLITSCLFLLLSGVSILPSLFMLGTIVLIFAFCQQLVYIEGVSRDSGRG